MSMDVTWNFSKIRKLPNFGQKPHENKGIRDLKMRKSLFLRRNHIPE